MFRSPHFVAVSQAMLVTFLWSTSWVLIKIGLDDIPALTFAGLRYMLAFLCLLPLGFRRINRDYIRRLTRSDWLLLLALGLLLYAITQGAQFAALVYLPSATLSLLLNFSTVVTALIAIAMLNEYPRRAQWAGIGIYLIGILFYFWPLNIPTGQGTGLIIGIVGVLANACAAVVGRFVNHRGKHPVLVVTLISMGSGGFLLLLTGLITRGMPTLSLSNWLIIGWLAVVNTAFAFTLWNHTLRTLSAVESSIINSTMLPQIALLAWVFLGESITLKEIIAMIIAIVGIFIVQLYGKRSTQITAKNEREKLPSL